MRVKHPKSLQTGCAEQTIGLRCCFRWYPLLQFIIPLFRYFNTLGQNVQRFYTRTRQKYGLKAEQPKLWLCVCVCVCFFFFFSGSTFWARTFKRIIFFLLCVVLPFAYALCDQFDAMIMPCDTFRECPHGTQSKLVSYTAGSMPSLSVEFRTHTNKIYLPC